MPVNVAFGPSAGISGALAFGTGKRKYSDQKAQIEQQSKRQMLSDAMNFAKFLQDTRRPEEDQRRALARMDKQQEIAQENVTFEQGIKQKAVQWDLDFKNKARNEQMDALEAAIGKIDEEAKAKEAADVPKQDIAKWRNEAIGNSRARILGTSPPQPRNPYDGAVQMGGQEWFTDPNTGKYVNASKDKAAADLKQKEIDNDTLRIVHDAVNKGSVAISTAYKDDFDLLKAGYEALETRRTAGADKYGEGWLGSAEHTQYENDKRALDAKFEALQIRKRKDLRRMETGILAPYAAQGDEGRRSGAASVFAGRLGQLQREEELERAEREEAAFIQTGRDAGTMAGAQSLGEALLARDPESRRGLELQQRHGDVRGINPPWGATSEGSENYLPASAPTGTERVTLDSGKTIDPVLASQIAQSPELARAAIRKGLLTPGDAATLMTDAQAGKQHSTEIALPGQKKVLFKGTSDQTATAEAIAKDASHYAAIAARVSKGLPDGPQPTYAENMAVADKRAIADLANKIADKLADRVRQSAGLGGVDPAKQQSDALLTRELKKMKGELNDRLEMAEGGRLYSSRRPSTPPPPSKEKQSYLDTLDALSKMGS